MNRVHGTNKRNDDSFTNTPSRATGTATRRRGGGSDVRANNGAMMSSTATAIRADRNRFRRSQLNNLGVSRNSSTALNNYADVVVDSSAVNTTADIDWSKANPNDFQWNYNTQQHFNRGSSTTISTGGGLFSIGASREMRMRELEERTDPGYAVNSHNPTMIFNFPLPENHDSIPGRQPRRGVEAKSNRVAQQLLLQQQQHQRRRPEQRDELNVTPLRSTRRAVSDSTPSSCPRTSEELRRHEDLTMKIGGRRLCLLCCKSVQQHTSASATSRNSHTPLRGATSTESRISSMVAADGDVDVVQVPAPSGAVTVVNPPRQTDRRDRATEESMRRLGRYRSRVNGHVNDMNGVTYRSGPTNDTLIVDGNDTDREDFPSAEALEQRALETALQLSQGGDGSVGGRPSSMESYRSTSTPLPPIGPTTDSSVQRSTQHPVLPEPERRTEHQNQNRTPAAGVSSSRNTDRGANRNRTGNYPSSHGNIISSSGSAGERWELDNFSYEALLELGSMAVPTGLGKEQLRKYEKQHSQPFSYNKKTSTNANAEEKSATTATTNKIECTICIDPIEEGEKTLRIGGCGHVFHTACILPWLARTNRCPTCRAEIPRKLEI